mgnify:CR=1 FL=1
MLAVELLKLAENPKAGTQCSHDYSRREETAFNEEAYDKDQEKRKL